MTTPFTDSLLQADDDRFTLADYQGGMPRWCNGCGNNGVLTAMQRLCREKQLPPEKTVFVSGIGCSSRFPHYMKTYGFHSLHGRALPVAEGIKMVRPDLHVFVNTGDGDCCSIGTAHWIHAIRYNIDMTVMMHDNHVYGLTKMQASPTSPRGMKSRTSPQGAHLDPLNPLTVTLGVANASFVAQTVDWNPELLYDIVSQAYNHKGFSFVRIIQRCPEFLPEMFEPWLRDPDRITLLTHENGIRPDAGLAALYKNRETHDPADIHRARELASMENSIPVGVLYRNPDAPRYDEAHYSNRTSAPDVIQSGLEAEMDKYTVWPDDE